MSYRLEYRYAGLLIPGASLHDGVDRYAICIEGGDNNVWEHDNKRRARSWDCSLLGTREEVMEGACYFASSCEDGNLQPNGKNTTPEAYIARIEKLVDSARNIEIPGSNDPRISLVYRCSVGSENDSLLSSLGVDRVVEKVRWKSDGSEEAVFKFTKDYTNDYRTFFSIYSKIKGEKTAGWLFATCTGPY